jgi:hypothetical protein
MLEADGQMQTMVGRLESEMKRDESSGAAVKLIGGTLSPRNSGSETPELDNRLHEAPPWISQ